MVTYSQKELVSATEFSKQFGSYLSKISNGLLSKIGILKNNKINAIILPVQDYENMILELEEAREKVFLTEVLKRVDDKPDKFVDGTEALKKFGLSLDV